ncbi:MAG: alcohol dehydrogenase catalytic domain-containing protein [Acidobacteria bacterium]|nr:alcohol dehydrogenase catalytic domain-containing protein [Acidobacteriota bacterium]
MAAKMKLGLYFRNDDVRVEECPVLEIGPAEVLVRVVTCGVCGSDTMQWYREPEIRRKGGINTGHEIAGDIVQVGHSVHNFQVGDRVVVAHHFPCGQCALCKEGNETACEYMREKHIEPGGFAEYIMVRETGIQKGILRLPDSMSYAEGSLIEPLGCVIRSVRKASPIRSHSVLVIGSGLAGLLHIKLARALGASKIYAVDTNASRLEAASRSGADEVILATCTEGELPKVDRVFVCAASPKAAECAMECVNRGGHLMFFAADGPDHKLALTLTKFWLMQPVIGFTYGASPDDMREAMELIRSGTVPVDDLITHTFALEQIAEAFDLAANPRGNSLKVLIAPNGGNAQARGSGNGSVPGKAPVVTMEKRTAANGWIRSPQDSLRRILGQAIQKLMGQTSIVS